MELVNNHTETLNVLWAIQYQLEYLHVDNTHADNKGTQFMHPHLLCEYNLVLSKLYNRAVYHFSSQLFIQRYDRQGRKRFRRR